MMKFELQKWNKTHEKEQGIKLEKWHEIWRQGIFEDMNWDLPRCTIACIWLKDVIYLSHKQIEHFGKRVMIYSLTHNCKFRFARNKLYLRGGWWALSLLRSRQARPSSCSGRIRDNCNQRTFLRGSPLRLVIPPGNILHTTAHIFADDIYFIRYNPIS